MDHAFRPASVPAVCEAATAAAIPFTSKKTEAHVNHAPDTKRSGDVVALTPKLRVVRVGSFQPGE